MCCAAWASSCEVWITLDVVGVPQDQYEAFFPCASCSAWTKCSHVMLFFFCDLYCTVSQKGNWLVRYYTDCIELSHSLALWKYCTHSMAVSKMAQYTLLIMLILSAKLGFTHPSRWLSLTSYREIYCACCPNVIGLRHSTRPIMCTLSLCPRSRTLCYLTASMNKQKK